MRAARIWRPETMLLITDSIYDSGNATTGHPALSKLGPDIRYQMVACAGLPIGGDLAAYFLGLLVEYEWGKHESYIEQDQSHVSAPTRQAGEGGPGLATKHTGGNGARNAPL